MPRDGQRVLTFSVLDAAADYFLARAPEPMLTCRGEALLPVAAMRLQGEHNAANALAVLAMADALELPRAPVLAALAEFGGLPHRAQWVAELGGVRFVNDSKGTNVGATIAAVAGLPGPLVLIAGGDGKDQDFGDLRDGVRGQGAPRRADRPRRAAPRGRAGGRLHGRVRGRHACRGGRSPRRGSPGRHGAVVAGLREPRHVPRLHASRRRIRDRGPEPCRMTAATLSYARSTGRPRRLALDPWVLGPVAALLLIGLVMVASASIGVSDRELGAPFFYFQRQLMYVGLGLGAAAFAVMIPTAVWEKYSMVLLAVAFALLCLVLVPGLGHEVNGSRRWLRLGFMNFQVSELARVLLLTYLASYAVRRGDELVPDFKGFMKPVAVLAAAAVLLLVEPDFGAATVLMATGLAVLFLAGVGSTTCSCRSSSGSAR